MSHPTPLRHYRERFYGKHKKKDQHPSPRFRKMEEYSGKAHEYAKRDGEPGRSRNMLPRARAMLYSSLLGNGYKYRDILLMEMISLFPHHHSLTNTELRKLAQQTLRENGIEPPRRS